MSELYTTGTWTPKAGAEEAFVEAWSEFAAWASGMPGAGTLRLTRDTKDPTRFVSFGRWESEEAVRAWKNGPEFGPRMARVREHVDAFQATELEVLAAARSGSTTSALPV
jgi:heme-degrading monooxygenase HmoA